MGQRRYFSKVFKLEAVNLVVSRGVSFAQACRDLGVAENITRRSIQEFRSSEGQAFPGHGVQKPAGAWLTWLRRKVAKLKRGRHAVRIFCKAPRGMPVRLIREALSVSRVGFFD